MYFSLFLVLITFCTLAVFHTKNPRLLPIPKFLDQVLLVTGELILFAFTKKSRFTLESVKGDEVAFVTGCSKGLGQGIAIRLAALGVRVLMGCRSSLAETEQEVYKQAKALAKPGVIVKQPQCIFVDVSKFDSIEKAVQEIKKLNVNLKYFVANAAIVPIEGKKDEYGIEAAVTTNYLGHFYLTKRLLEEKILLPAASADDPVPRIVVVSSETHRYSDNYDKRPVDRFIPYTMSQSLRTYAYTKWLLICWTFQLARVVNDSRCRIKICAICPGPINSNIAHRAPKWAQAIVKPMMKLFFTEPTVAAEYILRLLFDEPQAASSTELASPFSKEANYYHMWKKKEPRPDAIDKKNGEELWADSEQLIKTHAPKN